MYPGKVYNTDPRGPFSRNCFSSCSCEASAVLSYGGTQKKMKNILVIGATGFVGRNIILDLVKNYNVYAKFELESCYDIDTFTVEKNFKLIGYNDDVTIIMYIKPQLNDINYNIIISECIIDLFMIKYCSIIDNRKKIIKKNKLISCVITFDYNQKPYFIDWENEFKNDFYKNNKNHVINTIKEYIIYSCTNNHDKIYDYFRSLMLLV